MLDHAYQMSQCSFKTMYEVEQMTRLYKFVKLNRLLCNNLGAVVTEVEAQMPFHLTYVPRLVAVVQCPPTISNYSLGFQTY
jgi:hypothetical protein